MPIRALCTICSDFFDHSRDVAAIHCGHTFHLQCLIQWFDTAPSRTCPQCRIQVGRRTIINKLFFDLAQEEEDVLDAEFLKNELDNIRAQLSQKEREKRDSQVIIDSLRDTLEERNATVASLQKALDKAEMLCSTLKKQMKFLEQQQDETKQAREEARRLRSKMHSMERIELLLQSQRPEVEEMIRDMGVGHSAVEQLAVYCVSLKKEYENLKEARKASGELADKLKKDLFSSRSKLQTVYSELDQTKLELKSAQKDLQSADKEIASLKKKLTMLQETLNLPPVASETVNRLVLESPAPVEMLKLRRPVFSDDIDLNATFDVDTPPARPSGIQHGQAKKLCTEKTQFMLGQDHIKPWSLGPHPLPTGKPTGAALLFGTFPRMCPKAPSRSPSSFWVANPVRENWMRSWLAPSPSSSGTLSWARNSSKRPGQSPVAAQMQ
ncbi:E3 ubiquitin-protein ligase TRAIP isoform X3 [Pteropus medius]|uniref:E3 ubiquitin-protein ligase TRAIP isoform X3 n=1 Tax=Pteropus vampyrus TaxID=132908 RepID=UPI00196AC034|nr:E3 ubiquitin-protein ligase TRAIP isoform X3 [Pteropus giganteus]